MDYVMKWDGCLGPEHEKKYVKENVYDFQSLLFWNHGLKSSDTTDLSKNLK